MITKTNLLKILPVALLAIAVALSPSFSVGTIESGREIDIRAEDIVIALLLLWWLFGFVLGKYEFKDKLKKTPFFVAISIWLAIGFLSTLANLFLGNVYLLRSFFFFLKEVEFFLLYFYIFWHLAKKESVDLIAGLWIFLAFINSSWIVFELFTGLKITHYYGPTTFIEPEGTSPGGGFLLIIFIFLLNLFLYYYRTSNLSKILKFFIGTTIIFLMAGIVSSGSREIFWGSIFAIILTIIIYILKDQKPERFFVLGIVLLALFTTICIVMHQNYVIHQNPALQRLVSVDSIIREITNKDAGTITRINVWQKQLELALKKPLFLIFGFGKSVILFSGESHSQYIRNLVEVGIVGSLAFLYLIFLIVKKNFKVLLCDKDAKVIAYSASLFVATATMLLMAFFSEVFIVVKIAEVYWFFVAMSLAYFYINSQNRINEIKK